MGEVGAAIPEKQTESPSVNGEVNGVCKPTEDETEQMDVDTEDSQISSSENGISQNSEEASTKEVLISKAESVTEDSKVKASDSKDASPDKLSDNIAADENTNDDDDDEDDVDDDDEDTETPAENKDEIKENGLPESPEPSSVEKPDEEEDEEEEEVKTVAENKTAEVSKNGPESAESAGPKKAHENSEKKCDKNEKVVDKEEDKQKVDDETEEKTSATQNGKVDEPPAETKNQSADEIELISDEEQDPIPEDPTDHIVHNTTNDSSSDIPQLKISKVQENVEQMEVDSTTNGNTGGCDTTTTSRSKAIDDDGAVVIQSDSESEVDSPSKNKTQQDDDIHEILSDKDDCVVIEDDDKKDKEDIAVRRTTRQRKSVVKVRDFSAFGDDDDDDDIEEIVDDDQPPSKRLKSSASNSPSTPSNMMPQVGQITIKDARSLMGTSYIEGTPKGTFQQQFIQATGGNQSPLQNLSKQNSPFTVIPGGSPGQGVFVGNVRPTLAPLTSTPQPKLAPITPTLNQSPLSLTNPTLLPALTDDMFVLEAPSFIVPYIYEKPPSENLKEIVLKIGDELEKLKMETSSGGDKSEDHKANADSMSNAAKNDAAGASTSGEKSAETSKKKSSRRKGKNPDDSWDESDTSTDEEASDSESRTKVLIKEAKEDLDSLKAHILTPEVVKGTTIQASPDVEKKADNYFESPLGKFFVDIGINLVQEFVQADLLRQQKRKQERAKMPTAEIELAIKSLKSNLETSKKRNEPFKFEMKRCEYCNFKSESALSMAHHYETPHMRNYAYKCNFCPFETRPPHDILFHMEAVHNIKGRLEKAPSYHQCPNCPFEDNGKSKLARHAPVCLKKFRPEGNLLPPHDWEAPAKIPRIKPRHGLVGTATAYQAMAAQAAAQKAALATIAARNNITPVANNTPPAIRNRGRPQTVTRPAPGGGTMMRNTTPLRPQMPAGVVLPNNYQITAGGQLIQVAGSSLAILPNSHSSLTLQTHNNKKNTGQQPSISITPLPRQPGAAASNTTSIQAATLATAPTKPAGGLKPGQSPTGGKASFVICEICDGYIKDLEQLRNHMQWMHKVKIHPKMIYNRPPLNCQKCQFRFFTDQGLERHLLGSHGLVTSSMQEAANKGRDAGRCPVCGRMYQWKLLNHVSRDHHMTLKPAHLSYKCTVCTATFGMYKQFENHVYTAHSTVAKKAMDSKKSSSNSSGVSISNASLSSGVNNSVSISTSNKTSVTALTGGDSLLKPLKINDEITIIPQPATKSRGSASNDYESHVID